MLSQRRCLTDKDSRRWAEVSSSRFVSYEGIGHQELRASHSGLFPHTVAVVLLWRVDGNGNGNTLTWNTIINHSLQTALHHMPAHTSLDQLLQESVCMCHRIWDSVDK